MKLSIYLLRDPITNKPTFVGITKNLSALRRKHPILLGHQNPNKYTWIKQLVKAKLRPKIEFITHASPYDAKWKREMVIKHLNTLGYELFNVTAKDTNLKRSQSMKSLWQNNDYRSRNLNKKLDNLVSNLGYLKDVPSL